MTTTMKRRNSHSLLFLVTMISIILLAACNRSGQRNNEGVDTTDLSAEGIVLENDTLSEAFAAYIAVKDALVASDSKLAGEASNNLSEHLKRIHGCENTAVLAQELANTNDLGLQRSAFAHISTDLIAMYQHTSLNAGKIYVIHCPMYQNRTGADWLSTSSEVKNPYFGEEMLTCGSVTQEIE